MYFIKLKCVSTRDSFLQLCLVATESVPQRRQHHTLLCQPVIEASI